jgi:hypothetical protein
VPSWSWMAYDGEITYIDLQFGGVDWSKDIRSMFSPSARDLTPPTDPNRLSALSREFSSHEGQLVLDTGREYATNQIMCVVVGKQKGNAARDYQAHWILIVAPGDSDDVSASYKRVGVGSVQGRCIAFDKPGLEILIS